MKTLSNVLATALAFVLAFSGVISSAIYIPASANNGTPGITLNGTVNTNDPGYLNSKSIILSSGVETKVNYRLVPDYSSGAATGVIVKIFLPSLEYVNDDYVVVSRNATPTPLGVQGRVSAGGGWNVLSDTTVKGGPIIMEYDGDLGAGTNPAFDIFLTTYDDGTDGIYGSVPEGTTFELNGFVEYEMFNRVPGSDWKTNDQELDNESRVSVISSNLKWTAEIKPYVENGQTSLFPIWDRYQYADYLYTIKNTSTNLASNIDGYNVTFDIDSKDSNVNGIIPFDINRFKYNPSGEPIENPNKNDTSGLFVGIPERGGVLIYDVTHWDGNPENLGETIPYTYTGAGMIVIDKAQGAAKTKITPNGAPGDTERKYLVSLPLSRQGFPSTPTIFKVRAVTNTLFAKNANWSKTSVAEREVATPIYNFTMNHTTKQNDVVYGYETYNEIKDFKNASNAPVFNTSVTYETPEDFEVNKVVYEIPKNVEEKFQNSKVTYSYVDPNTQELVTEELDDYTRELSDDENTVFYTFDLTFLKDIEWDNILNFTLVDRINPGQTAPGSIKVYGEGYKVGAMKSTATVNFIEKIASNDDYGQNTTYTEVPHAISKDVSFNVIYPREAIPSIRFQIDGTYDAKTVPYKNRSDVNVYFGFTDNVAENSTTTITVNPTTEVVKNVELTIKKELFEQADVVGISYVTLDGEETALNLDEYDTSEDIILDLPEGFSKIIIKTNVIETISPQNFISFSGEVSNGTARSHTMTGSITSYQPKPYDKNTTRNNTGVFTITLPNELTPSVGIVGVYGDRRTTTSTNVSYESTFDVEYQLNTGDVLSPESTYTINMQKPSKTGHLLFNSIKISQDYIDNVEEFSIIIVGENDEQEEFTAREITSSDIDFSTVKKIIIKGKNVKLNGSKTIATVSYDADIVLGSQQNINAQFVGSQIEPHFVNKTATTNNMIVVSDTKTTSKTEGVNQVTKDLGVGNDYSVDIYRCWNCGYTYSKADYTLDQGYKSLGGFTSTIYRPTATYLNNNQKTTVSVDLPHDHFDLYYVKIRDNMKNYIEDIDIYRLVDGEEVLWKTIPGSEWVNNSQEGSRFWRINTAHADNDGSKLFETFNSVAGVTDHPYYKDAWDEDVYPESPVTRVDVNLEFTRTSNNAAPQMSGTNEDVIEYMGRFYTPSSKGKEITKTTTIDVIGNKVPVDRTDSSQINSLVQFPYAQTRTGAHDNTSLANKVITMGNIGEYLASVWNVNDASWPYYNGHGPDIYIPFNTEYDEWLGLYNPAGFHDKLIYEFVYPASPNDDNIYNYDPKYFTVHNTSALKYMETLQIIDENGSILSHNFVKDYNAHTKFTYDNSLPRGVYENVDGTVTISLGKTSTEVIVPGEGEEEDTTTTIEEDIYPAKFRVIFEKVPGFGEKTAEIAGVSPDTLGTNLNEVDIRVGGIVNGNQALRGTTNLYRHSDYADVETLMNTTSATLTGYTPKLGARVDLSYDNTKVYDYNSDGITPFKSRVTVGIENSSEADIKNIALTFTPDSSFRSQKVEIPAAIFNGQDWSVKTVVIRQGSASVTIPLTRFVLNESSGNYELNLLELFADGTLSTDVVNVSTEGAATLLRKNVTSITANFEPKDSTVRLWGSLARAESEESLPTRMLAGGNMFITGVWVDETSAGSNWLSKPTFVSESTKASHEVMTAGTNTSASANVTTYQPIFTSAGGANNSPNPVITHQSNYSNGAPWLYNRVARLSTIGTHVKNDYSITTDAKLFYDSDTNAQIAYNNITVGDTAKVLYELRNVGKVAPSNTTAGNIPVFNPVSYVTVPSGLKISNVQAVTSFIDSKSGLKEIVESSPNTANTITENDVTITYVGDKQAELKFNTVLEDGESVFYFVEFTAINDFTSSLLDTQNKTVEWNVYSRPAYTHQYMSYNSDGVNGHYTNGTTATRNFDGGSVTEHLGRVYNTNYRYANPNQLVVANNFDVENVSGKEMNIRVRNIFNELLHDNTRMELLLTLDKKGLGGFELTEFPEPKYPAGFVGEYPEPIVYYKNANGEWVNVEDFSSLLTPDNTTASENPLKGINEIKVDYGIVPATYDSSMFAAPDFTIVGIGHWKGETSATAKSYVIPSHGQIVLTHLNDVTEASQYAYLATDNETVYKAMPQIEFNVQSFDTRSQAEGEYSPSATGKTSYVAGDEINYKITARNINSFQGTSTNTPYGKAPLLSPVVYDKIPEYLITNFEQYIDEDGAFNIEDAISNNDIIVRIFNADGTERTTAKLPKVTVESITGFDIAGDQTFDNSRKNDGYGRLSNSEPINMTVNPAEEIDFSLFTYDFNGEILDRGERLEIIYTAHAREEGLPYAKYSNGKSVFAPFYGWYNSNNVVSSSAKNVSMDMASLLHDAGITGNKGHEMTSNEFLSSSRVYLPGNNTQRRVPTSNYDSRQVTFYDSSANKETAHLAYMNETAHNSLYTSFQGSILDENFEYVNKGRVNDGKVASSERVLWAQDGVQLNRAWLYAASEMVPNVERASHGVDSSNFYEHDGSLNSYNIHRLGYSPYVEDNYTYAVQLHEEFTIKLHATNMGDRNVESGLEYTEILPLGVSPYDEEGNLLGIQAYNGIGEKIDSVYEVVQTPENDKGYRAPAQSQEGGTYKTDVRDDMIPYVIKVKVSEELTSMFKSPGSNDFDRNQSVHIKVRVYEELPPSSDGKTYWHDQFTLTTIEEEEYVETYSKEYGAFNAGIGSNNAHRYPNDGILAGINVNDLVYDFGTYSSYWSVEPWGKYVRGLNAQGTSVTQDGKPAIVTGDQIAMRKPTLRVWSNTTKEEYSPTYNDTIENFFVDPYEEFTINSIVENQQLEVTGEYNRRNSGYNRYSGDNYSDDIWVNAPQTIGGARGTWFEPTVTIALPYGIAPVVDGEPLRYYSNIEDINDVDFTASINDIKYNSSTLNKDVTDNFNVRVELIEDAEGKRFVLYFVVKDAKSSNVNYGQSLVISPKVVAIDTPIQGIDNDGNAYQEVLTFAHTKRPVFNPIVSSRYTTGSVPSTSARDLASGNAPNNVVSSNGSSISNNDRTRLDSSSTWNSNMGYNKITERLVKATQYYTDSTNVILDKTGEWVSSASEFNAPQLPSKHDKGGAYGASTLKTRIPSVKNQTLTSVFDDSLQKEMTEVDAAGKYWYSTEVTNSVINNSNPYVEYATSGNIHNSRFVITQDIVNFAKVTEEVRIKVNGKVLDRTEFESEGYSVELINSGNIELSDGRKRVQWMVTPPANERGTLGSLQNNEKFNFMYQVELVDGYSDNINEGSNNWVTPELTVDSYVSVVADDLTLITGSQKPEDFIIQDTSFMKYTALVTDSGKNEDIDSNGDMDSYYAHDTARVEIIKPKAEVRVNTVRPRIEYSNGLSGDTYFNSSDIIEYMTSYAKITGSGLKKFIVENIVPSYTTNDDTVRTTETPINTSVLFVTSGEWELPQETLDRIEKLGKTVDDYFKTFVYVSYEDAENDYESGEWELLNPDGTSILVNERFDIPTEKRDNMKKIRVVVEALNPSELLVPTGTRMNVDANPETENVKEEVVDLDPSNHSTKNYPTSVTEKAMKVGMRISSDSKSTLFIYDTVQAWGNYVAESITKLAQSETRSYLTPSRPVVNVKYDTLYYRSDNTKPQNERFGWSDITTIAPKSSPHLKFKGEFINADDSMWARDEDNAYSEDTLIDPFVTFQLPTVMETKGDFTYVPSEDITDEHPLSSDHRSRYSLTSNETNMWTWKLVRADGEEIDSDSFLSHTRIYAGPWDGSDRNHVSIWFDGIVYPGDKIVVEFIGAVDAYSPGADNDDLKSRAYITNNTGILQPLNSLQNSANKLGYSLDTYDFNENKMVNDRVVFAERLMFQYETYDNFGKRKVAYSDLNKAGTVAPESTPVRSGGEFSFEISVDNSKESSETPYPYPIFYDVLPHYGDTSIIGSKTPRNSSYSALLMAEGMTLESQGANPKIYPTNSYTVYVGPFTKSGGNIIEAPMISESSAETEEFFNSLGTPTQVSAVRDAHFVKLSEIQNNTELLKKAKTILVMFNNSNEVLPGQNKLKFTYTMTLPINAPTYLEQFDNAERKNEVQVWNSFVATQRAERFIPQESNLAGAYSTERADNVYIGNYVWNDVNYNGIKDEGKIIVDDNGRELLNPSKYLDNNGTIDDPGVNGVKVTLLSANGYHVDQQGRSIKAVGNEWHVIDDLTGEIIKDDVFLLPIVSDGPLVTTTETDFHGNKGYYTFSNIAEGEYRVMYEFPSSHNLYSATTLNMFKNTSVKAYAPGENIDLPVKPSATTLTVVTEPALVDLDTTDEERMSFDLGVAHTVKIGGVLFKENPATLDGLKQSGEAVISGYNVYLKDMNGNTVQDSQGREYAIKTDAQGRYDFRFLPVDLQYYVQVTDVNDEYNEETVVSPIIHNINPFAANNDNDGYSEKNSEIVRSNTMNFSIEELIASNFADKLSVNVGFYDKQVYGAIGNRVWIDENRNGLQDEGEPGVTGQTLHLEQYIKKNDEWVKTDFEQSVVTNSDGYYYFTQVPSFYTEEIGNERTVFETRYQVVVTGLPNKLTFAKPYTGNNIDLDSNFYENGTMHSGVVGNNLLTISEKINEMIFGKDDLTADLGLVYHDRSELSGEVFIDSNKDGINNDSKNPETEYTATLQVNNNGTWVDARMDSEGLMIEPRFATENDDVYTLVNTNEYSFEGLHIINTQTLTAYEYRVIVTEIPLWQVATDLRSGDDSSVDNDFSDSGRTTYNIATSETYILGELTPNGLRPVKTITGVPAVHVDLGVVELETEATIGDYIWYDLNRDGIQNNDENGVPGLRVVLNELIDGELVYVDETVTDENGRYEFTAPVSHNIKGLNNYNTQNKYVIEFNMTSRQTITEHSAGENDVINSKFINLVTKGNALYKNNVSDARHTVVSDVFTLAQVDENNLVDYTTTQSVDNIDGGVIVHETIRVIGDTMYEDENKNGTQEVNEPGISGLTVQLYMFNKLADEWEIIEDLNGNSELVTDENGKYEFVVEVAELDKESVNYSEPYEYRVLVKAPANMRLVEENNEFSYVPSGNVDGIVIDKPYSYVITEPITMIDTDDEGVILNTAVDHLTADAGWNTYSTQTEIGGVSWEDSNEDGLRDSDETPHSGKIMTLWENIDGEWVIIEDMNGNSTVTTNELGEYRFTVSPTHYDEGDPRFLTHREYKVTTEREGWQLWSPVNIGDDITLDSDVESNENFGNIHTGVTHSFNVVDLLPLEEEGNNDSEEGGDDFIPASEPVEDNSDMNEEEEPKDDSEVVRLVDVTTVRDDINMGVGLKTHTQTVKIGGVVWNDENQDGIRDSSENLLEGRQVTLWVNSDDEWVDPIMVQESHVITDNEGRYSFEVPVVKSYDEDNPNYLTPYEYRVTVERHGFEEWSPMHSMDDVLIDSDVERTNEYVGLPTGYNMGTMGEYSTYEIHETGRVDITSLKDDLSKDAGVYSYESTTLVGGIIWDDVNENSLFEKGENALKDITVSLWEKINDEWVIVEDVNGNSKTVTSSYGYYSFIVEPAVYDVESERFMQKREYRTTIELPEGYNISANATATLNDTTLESIIANIATMNNEGVVDMKNVTVDETLNFELVKVDPALDITSGEGYSLWVAVTTLLTGAMILALIRSQRLKTQLNIE